jgi:hypothetical protein
MIGSNVLKVLLGRTGVVVTGKEAAKRASAWKTSCQYTDTLSTVSRCTVVYTKVYDFYVVLLPVACKGHCRSRQRHERHLGLS